MYFEISATELNGSILFSQKVEKIRNQEIKRRYKISIAHHKVHDNIINYY